MKPVLLLLKGQPGSGKSTLGRALAKDLKWALIDKDDARNAFQQLVESHREVNWNSLSYTVMFNYASTQLACGVSVILDCPLARRELFDRAAAVAAEVGATVMLVECEARNKEAWRQRVELRGKQDAGTNRSHKPGSWHDVQLIMQRNGNSESWSGDVDLRWRVQVDTTSPLEQQVASVLGLLEAAARG